MVAILSEQRDIIFDAVRAMYTSVAQRPDGAYHFPVGRSACELVGYPDDLLGGLPPEALESFAGVAFPFAANVIDAGDTVLDIGSGSGTDLLVARGLVGSAGTVIGLDLTDAMIEKLGRITAAAGAAGQTRLLNGNAERIPLPDDAVDVVTSNGVLNLVPDKERALSEIHRVLRPGGRVQIADIVLGRPLSDACRADPQLWAECVVGATELDRYIELFAHAGFDTITVLGQFDYFAASSSAETRSIASSFGACSIVLRAAKPPAPALRQPLPWPPERRPSHSAPAELPAADVVVDASGRSCGSIEPLLGARIRELASGQIVELVCDDPAARAGIPAWLRLTGHTLLATARDSDTHTRFFLRRK